MSQNKKLSHQRKFLTIKIVTCIVTNKIIYYLVDNEESKVLSLNTVNMILYIRLDSHITLQIY